MSMKTNIKPNYFLNVLFIFAAIVVIFCMFLTGGAAHAQSAIAVNKYLVEAPPALPGAATIFATEQNPILNKPYTYVVQVLSGSGSVNITDSLPTGFQLTACLAFVDGSPALNVSGTCPNMQFSSAGNSPNQTAILYITGTFTSTGPVTNTVTATVGGGVPVSNSVSVNVIGVPPVFDLKVTKTASPSPTALGTTITYTTEVENLSNVDVPMAGILALFDRVTNTSASNELEITWGWVSCTTTPLSACVRPPTSNNDPITLEPGQSTDIFTTSSIATTGIGLDPSGSGIIKAGAKMTIVYEVNVDSYDPCAPTPMSIDNFTYLGLGSASGNFPDSNSSNNQASVSVPLTGLPKVCPPPSLSVSKVVRGPAVPQWGVPIIYQVTVKNIATVPVDFRYVDRVFTPATVSAPFSVQVLPATCAPGPCKHKAITPPPLIGSNPEKIIEWNSPPSPGILLLPGQSYVLTYGAIYDATCQRAGGKNVIVNEFIARGKVLANPKFNTKAVGSVKTVMPPLPVCQLNVSKVWKSKVPPHTPLNFGAAIGTYEVSWKNPPTAPTIRLGAIWDVLHIDNSAAIYPGWNIPARPQSLYPTVPVTFSSPVCVSSGVAWSNTLASSTGTNVSPGQPGQGAKVISSGSSTFVPGASLVCTYTITAKAPLPSDPRCQTSGTPYLWNTVLADLDPAYNPTRKPFAHNMVAKRLPLCRSITITKSANPVNVLPGDPVKWNIVITNRALFGNAPNNGPISFDVTDSVNSLLGAPTGIVCNVSAAPSASCASTLTGTVINTKIANLRSHPVPPAPDHVDVYFTTTSPTTAYTIVPNTALAQPIVGYYYYTPNPSATTYIRTTWPAVTKAFTPSVANGAVTKSLTFTITNLAYHPAVSGMSFTDQLPIAAGTSNFSYGPITANTCGGTATLLSNPDRLAVSGVNFVAGAVSCTITLEVSGTQCGIHQNKASDVTNVNKLDVSGLDASLEIVQPCDAPPPPLTCSDEKAFCVKAITGSSFFGTASYGCALFNFGNVKCWGTGPVGSNGPAPVIAYNITTDPAKAIDAGVLHACTLTITGKVQCWGKDQYGQLGNGSGNIPSLNPVDFVKKAPVGNLPAVDLTNILDVSAGFLTSCAVDTSGSVWCWGAELGDFSGNPANIFDYATMVPGIADAISVSVGAEHACVVRTNTQAKCWGLSDSGELGDETSLTAIVKPPVDVLDGSGTGTAITGLASIRAGFKYTCALTTGGKKTLNQVLCWGKNQTGSTLPGTPIGPVGSLGTSDMSPLVLAPSDVVGLRGVIDLTVPHLAINSHNCVVQKGTNQIKCWGGNTADQIGYGPPTTQLPPVVGPLTVNPDAAITVRLDASGEKTCVVVGTQALGAQIKCWGARYEGQLGDGLTTPLQTAVPVTVIGIP